MKTLFHEYYPPDLESLWAHGLVALDSSVLLDFYRYSDDATADLFDTLKAIKERIWLPHQVALEYHLRRLASIHNELTKYGKLRGQLHAIEEQLKSKHQHPFIQPKTLASFGRLLKVIDRDLDAGEGEQKRRLKTDTVLDEITALFEDHIGHPYTDEQLAETHKEGEERYKNDVPPGYKDENKTRGHLYGDFIIWKQLLDKAKEHKQGVLFVTNERKPDWWHKEKDKDDIFGPRRELRHEMMVVANSVFYMYQADTFLKDARQYLHRTVKEETIQEVKHVMNVQHEAKGYVLHADPGRFHITGQGADMLVERHAEALALFGELLEWAGGIRDWCRHRKETPNMDAVAPDIGHLGNRGFHLYRKWSEDLPEKLASRLQAIADQCELAAQLQRPFQLRKAHFLEPAAKSYIEDLATYLGLPPSS